MHARLAAVPLLVSALLAACANAPAAAGCGYKPVPIAAVTAHDFAGTVGTLEILLRSERADPAVESFPDTSLQIRRAGASCDAEGGVWQRRAVFAAGDGLTVAAVESSGSNDLLVFFSAADCRRAGQIDVSNSRWRFVDRGVEITPANGPDRSPRLQVLGSTCRPAAPR